MANQIFRKGDQVSTINDNLKGVVLKSSGNFVLVLCEDGFEHEFESGELIKQTNWDALIGEPGPERSEKMPAKSPHENRSHVNKVKEVDLHLHEITESESGMGNYEKLQLQLGVARNELKKALQSKRKKIVFIHGRGQGVLRKELHKMLDTYPVDYHDASFMEYGQGATEVILYQNRKDPGRPF